MSDTAALHERLLSVEAAARRLLDVAVQSEDEVSVAVAFPLIDLRDAMKRLDDTRSAIKARMKLEGRWTG